ncbi:MAG: hypothetical protein IJD79_07890 [Clostridia bacterium]|nr:hypothetical protein [Clostridia bacterium]
MKRIIKSILMIISLSLLVGCTGNKDEGKSDTSNGTLTDSAAYYKIKATVNSVSSDELEVTATEDSEGSFGVYRILTSAETKYEGRDGKAITLSDINEGDIILISYNGQVMRSLPPQVVAIKIQILE